MKTKLLTILLILMFSLTMATPALAQGPGDGEGRFVFGGNLTLQEEETVKQGVIVFGGNFSMPASSTVEGDVAVFGGNATIDGTVNGQIVLFGGNLNVGKTAVIKGDVAILGGETNIAQGAKLEGKVTRWGEDQKGGFTAPVPPLPPLPPAPSVPEIPQAPKAPGFGSNWAGKFLEFVQDTAWNIALLIIVAAIGWLLATFMPQQMKTVADTMIEAPLMSFGVGFLSNLICIVLALTICLLCIAVPGFVVLAVAGLLGWVVAGQILGERLLAASGRSFPGFIQSTIIGVLVLTLIANMPIIDWIPCFGWILGFLGWLAGVIVALLGTGAVILTRFGTRPYDKSARSISFGPSSPAPRPRPAPTAWTEADLADLDVAPASEDELNAKIKAALDESDTEEEKPKKRKPRRKPADEETPEPDEPTPME